MRETLMIATLTNSNPVETIRPFSISRIQTVQEILQSIFQTTKMSANQIVWDPVTLFRMPTKNLLIYPELIPLRAFSKSWGIRKGVALRLITVLWRRIQQTDLLPGTQVGPKTINQEVSRATSKINNTTLSMLHQVWFQTSSLNIRT